MADYIAKTFINVRFEVRKLCTCHSSIHIRADPFYYFKVIPYYPLIYRNYLDLRLVFFGCYWLILFLSLVVKTNESIYSLDLTGMDKWMSELPEGVTKLPLSKLAIPGSHDSCSYCIDSTCALSEDNDAFSFLTFLGDFGKVVSARWGRTQDADLSEQLSAGIRYFDLRVISRECNGSLYFVHGQFAREVMIELNNISFFLNKNPKEVVILDFNHLYCFKPGTLSRLVNCLINVFGSKLTPRSERIPSLKDMWEKGFQVICLLDEQSESPLMWARDKISSPWPDTVDLNKLMEFIKSHPACEENRFHVTQGVLTPNGAYVMSHLFSCMSELAAPANDRIIKWLEDEVPKNQRNIVVIDFAVKMFPRYTQVVANLNSIE